MTTSVTVYRSTDASAPTLNGTAGSLIALLSACLVDGYGAKAPAGWTKPYTGTNKAAFYMQSGTPRMYVRVDDSGAQESRLVGYESMSDVDTGTNPFPTAGQLSGGIFHRKSGTADSTARPWMVLANGLSFYLLTATAGTTLGATPASSDIMMFFGAIQSYKSGDAYNVAINGSVATGVSGRMGTCDAPSTSGPPGATSGIYLARAYTQIGTAISCTKIVPATHAGSPIGAGSAASMLYTDGATGSLRLARVVICEPADTKYTERGHLPGMWAPLAHRPGTAYDTFSGSGDLTGKNFILLPVYAASTEGRAAFETDGTWGF
jgi:hypothetical protein